MLYQRKYNSRRGKSPKQTDFDQMNARKFFVGGNWKCVSEYTYQNHFVLFQIKTPQLILYVFQNGSKDSIKSLVNDLNDVKDVPSDDSIGNSNANCALL